MKSPSFVVKLMMPLLIGALFLIPEAHAGALSDAFTNTALRQHTYSASAYIDLDRNDLMEVPFDMNLEVEETGGRFGAQYGKEGTIIGRISDIADLPSEYRSLNAIDMEIGYRGSYDETSQTGYGEITKAWMKTDHRQMNKVLQMMNQFAKFLTGKSFRFSQGELAGNLSGLLPELGDEEAQVFISALTSNRSVSELLGAVGKLLDDFVESGFLVDQNVADGFGRNRLRGGQDMNYKLRLGDSVTPEGSRIMRQALEDFLMEVIPWLGQEFARDTSDDDAVDSARSITEFLQFAKNMEHELNIAINDGVISKLYLNLDLNSQGFPMQLSEEVVFNYRQSYNGYIPTNNSDIIDLNQIVEGFTTLAEMGQSAYNDAVNYNYNFEDFDTPPAMNVYNDVALIQEICNWDQSCVRKELRQMKKDLRAMKNNGVISSREYRRYLRDMRKASL